jgi:hypothetical protein
VPDAVNGLGHGVLWDEPFHHRKLITSSRLTWRQGLRLKRIATS